MCLRSLNCDTSPIIEEAETSSTDETSTSTTEEPLSSSTITILDETTSRSDTDSSTITPESTTTVVSTTAQSNAHDSMKQRFSPAFMFISAACAVIIARGGGAE
jgi:hypothetical protein